MGSTIENESNGEIVVNGTFNISDPDDWGMMGKFKDSGGDITGDGRINISNCDLNVETDASTFSNFTGTVHYYAASVRTQAELNAALASGPADVPYIFVVAGEDIEYTLTVTEPVTVTDRAFILYAEGDATRELAFEENGSLTLVNSTFVRGMYGSSNEYGKKVYDVGIDLNGGTLTNWEPFPCLTADALEDDTSADLTLPTPTRPGYIFIGWRLERFGQDTVTVSDGAFDITDDNSGYTFTAQWYMPAGTAITTPETVPVTDNNGNVSASAEVKSGTAEVTISAAGLDKVAGGVTVDLSTLKKEVTGATLSGSTVGKLAEKADSLTIGLTDSRVALDADILAAVADKAAGADVTLTVAEYDKTALSADVQRLIGDQPVYELSLKAGNTEIHELGGKAAVSLPYTPKAGENTEYVVVWRMVDGVPQPIACKYDAATGLATFITETFSLYVVAYFPFKDVAADSWYYGSAVYAYTSGLMQGAGDDTFEPGETVTRAMLVTMLYRLEGEPTVTAENPYTDVSVGQWYTASVIWAAENNIVGGYGGGLFGPLDTLTREQMVTILKNYAEYKSYEMDTAGHLSGFTDADAVSSWAREAMQWAYNEGIIQGDGTSLSPKTDSDRAQIAVVLERFGKSTAK